MNHEEERPKRGTLSTDQRLATAWLATESPVGIAFKPYLVQFKGGTAISFYKDGKVQSGTLAAEQDLVKSIGTGRNGARYETVGGGTVVCFDHNGFVLGY